MSDSKFITDKLGREIELRLEDEFHWISAYHEDTHLGCFLFTTLEGDEHEDDHLRVTNMFLEEQPGYQNCGIGTEIIRLAQEESGMIVTFGRSDGVKSELGDHLTGAGVPFADAIGRKRDTSGWIT